MKKAIKIIKKIKKIEFFYKKVLTIKKVNDIIIPVQKTEKEAKKMQEEEIIFDFSKLRGRIKEIYGTQTAFATAMLMNEATLSNKLNNNVEFSPKEIYRACLLLCIDLKKELTLYFFTPKVQKTEKQ
jgi:hypothetical protein